MVVRVSVVLRRTVCDDIREFKQISTAGANTAAGNRFRKKMRHCACQSVTSSRSVKSDYLSREVLP